MSKPKSPTAAGNFALMFGEDGIPQLIDCVDGDKTGLNAVGLAIINAGYSGVRALAVAGNKILWQGRLDTLEGAFFSLISYHATQGYPLPTPEQALKILNTMLQSKKGGSND